MVGGPRAVKDLLEEMSVQRFVELKDETGVEESFVEITVDEVANKLIKEFEGTYEFRVVTRIPDFGGYATHDLDNAPEGFDTIAVYKRNPQGQLENVAEIDPKVFETLARKHLKLYSYVQGKV